MRFTADLAPHARENRRRAWVVWGGLFALSFAVLLVLGVAATVNWQAAGTVRRRSAQVASELPALATQRAALIAALDRPGMHDQWERASRFNGLIDRKAVSWTRLFERLEALMPAPVQLVSIGPGHGQNAPRQLAIVIAAPTVPAGLTFVRTLEQAPDFAATSVHQVTQKKNGSQDPGAPVTLLITVEYHPALGPPKFFGQRATAQPPAPRPGDGRQP